MPCGSNDIKHFELDIDEKAVKSEAHGFKGNECVKQSSRLESAIGNTEKRTFKDAFYQKVKSVGRAIVGGGR